MLHLLSGVLCWSQVDYRADNAFDITARKAAAKLGIYNEAGSGQDPHNGEMNTSAADPVSVAFTVLFGCRLGFLG